MDIIKIKNILFVHNVLSHKAPKHFHNYFTIKTTDHNHRTINNPNSLFSKPEGSLLLPDLKTKAAKISVKYLCALAWNSALKSLSCELQKEKTILQADWMQKTSIFKLRKMLNLLFLNSY